MGEFSLSHILILSVILLVFFGPSRLPALGQSLGKAIKGFKDGLNETTTVNNDDKAPPIQLNQNQQGTQQTQAQKEKQNQDS